MAGKYMLYVEHKKYPLEGRFETYDQAVEGAKDYIRERVETYGSDYTRVSVVEERAIVELVPEAFTVQVCE